MVKGFYYLLFLFLFLILITYIFFKLTFYSPEIFSKLPRDYIETKNNLPVIDKKNIYNISDLKDFPKNSVIKIKGFITQINKERNVYTGLIEDKTGRVKFILKNSVLKKNDVLNQIIDDAVSLRLTFTFVVIVKDNYVEVLDAM